MDATPPVPPYLVADRPGPGLATVTDRRARSVAGVVTKHHSVGEG